MSEPDRVLERIAMKANAIRKAFEEKNPHLVPADEEGGIMTNGKCLHGSRWVKARDKWWKVVIAPNCECEEPETLFDMVGEADLDRDCEEINDKIGAEEWMNDPEDDPDDEYSGYADDPYDGQACNGCGTDPCICVQLEEDDGTGMTQDEKGWIG